MKKTKIDSDILNELKLLKQNKFISIGDFQDWIYDNMRQIKQNMKTYGFKKRDIKKIKNHYDLSNITDVDPDLLQSVEIEVYTQLLDDLLG